MIPFDLFIPINISIQTLVYLKQSISIHLLFFKRDYCPSNYNKSKNNYQYPQIAMNHNAIKNLLCPKQKWINDKDVNKCWNCTKEFLPLIRWRHHCRFCGKVFCSHCSRFIIWGDSINYTEERKLRHCEECRIKIYNLSVDENTDYSRKASLFNAEQQLLQLDIEDLQNPSTVGEITQRNTNHQSIDSRDKINQQCLHVLIHLSTILCEKQQLDKQSWVQRLANLVLKTVNEVQVDTFIRRQFFDLQKQIRIVMIKTPKDSVTAICFKGLILQKNMPSRQLQPHIKHPRILTIKPSIQADVLIKNQEVRFDEMIKNQNNILKNYLDKIFKLNPNVIFIEQHVSKVAFEYFLAHNVMVLSKVKDNELEAIEKLTCIKKRIDNLLWIDRYAKDDILGSCDKIYFKQIQPGEMLMFLENQAGIRSVLLGDYSNEINHCLRIVFQILLRIGWNLKAESQIKTHDEKIRKLQLSNTHITFFSHNENYSHLETFINSQVVSYIKVNYTKRKAIDLSKNYFEYCSRHRRSHLLQICEMSKLSKTRLYSGEDMFLGAYLLQCIISTNSPCKKCHNHHTERYFISPNCITITIQNHSEIKNSFFTTNVSEIEEEEETRPKQKSSLSLFNQITKSLKNFNQKIYFKLFFRCEDCQQIMGQSKIKISHNYLTINFLHYLTQLAHSFNKNEDKPIEIRKTKFEQCQHLNIVRVIQCPHTLIKFTVTKEPQYQIIPIYMNDAVKHSTTSKDEKMIRDLYKHELTEKLSCLDIIENEFMKMPFSPSGPFTSFSNNEKSTKAQYYQETFDRITTVLKTIREHLHQIEQSLSKYFEQVCHDWTIVMRKFYKVEHVLKILIEVNNLLINLIKKQKFEENTTSLQDLNSQKQFLSFEDNKSQTRKNSLQRMDQDQNPLFKSQSFMTHLSFRKDSSLEMDTELQNFKKKQANQRFLEYQGVHMYFPIGNINDPVSILACCLNSEQFNLYTQQKNIKDQIYVKIPFLKQLRTEWKISQQIQHIYKTLFKQDFDKNQRYEFTFSIYYHKDFEQLRINQGINFKSYIRSLYGCQNWDSSGGKSASLFSKSHNELLVVKIINDKEFIEFQKFAPAYLKYMKSKRQSNEGSHLAKIYGIYEANIRNKIYKFVVMQNIFLGMTGQLKVYDLKGSEVNRLAMPSSSKSFTGLDTNFIIDKDAKPYILQPSLYEKTIHILEQDANFLKEQAVIDYSLLVIQSDLNLRLGIIDFMRPYHLFEKIENIYKEFKFGKEPTVMPPQQYSERFIHAMRKYFMRATV